MRVLMLSLPVLALACRGTDKGGNEGEIGYEALTDADGDGWNEGDDCDDADAEVNPGAIEACDGVDNDCDGQVDEGAMGTFYDDADGDGYGDAAFPREACEAPDGTVTDSSDCDDLDGETYPGAPERCDEVDNDCDGEIDEELTELWYADTDGDGFGDADSTLDACDPEAGWVADATDCDDDSSAVFPGADEYCNELDDDCDGTVDEEDALDAATWYADTDADGYGDPGVTTPACEEPLGYSADAGDCDDSDELVNPGASELCNEIDDDCDGDIDEDDAVDAPTWYRDGDSDGYGDLDRTTAACEEPSGYTADATDCDDADDDVFPGATEWCNGGDDDCDGDVDEDDAADADTWYADTDADGYGDASSTTAACSEPSGYSANDEDCDDTESAVNPGEDEICNEVDDDCDGDVDEDDATDATTWYGDADGDGYGGTTFTSTACEQPEGYVEDSDDCDDLDEDINPDATELCDGEDNDCDGTTDEDDAADAATWTEDSDGDGYGASGGATTTACSEPSGYAATDDDCDDDEASINPGASEDCNGVDDDCDGAADDGVLGEDSVCAAESCLEVLEDGSPTDSDTFWLDPDGTGATEVYCDFGPVGGGWSTRIELQVENPTSGDLTDEWVAVEVDTETLVDDGDLEADGMDLRFFTHDGPLMRYWYAGIVGEGTTTVWVEVPELVAGDTVDFTITTGNPDTERRSLSWWFDGFDTDTSAFYAQDYSSSWGSPTWSWDTTNGVITTGNTNIDHFLYVDDSRLSLDEPVVVEARFTTYDNDAAGPMLTDGTGFVVATASDDYDGVAHTGQEAIVENTSTPTAHYVGSYLLELGDIDSPSSLAVGLSWDASELAYLLEGTEAGSVSATGYAFTSAGIGTYANSGSPGLEIEYLWIGEAAPEVDPEEVESDAVSTVGASSAF